jgi:hypothetical protein
VKSRRDHYIKTPLRSNAASTTLAAAQAQVFVESIWTTQICIKKIPKKERGRGEIFLFFVFVLYFDRTTNLKT